MTRERQVYEGKIQELESSINVLEAMKNMLEIENLGLKNSTPELSILAQNEDLLDTEMNSANQSIIEIVVAKPSDQLSASEVDAIFARFRREIKDFRAIVTEGYMKMDTYRDPTDDLIKKWELEKSTFVMEMVMARAQLEVTNSACVDLTPYFERIESESNVCKELQEEQRVKILEDIRSTRYEISTMLHEVAPEHTVYFENPVAVNEEALYENQNYQNDNPQYYADQGYLTNDQYAGYTEAGQYHTQQVIDDGYRSNELQVAAGPPQNEIIAEIVNPLETRLAGSDFIRTASIIESIVNDDYEEEESIQASTPLDTTNIGYWSPRVKSTASFKKVSLHFYYVIQVNHNNGHFIPHLFVVSPNCCVLDCISSRLSA